MARRKELITIDTLAQRYGKLPHEIAGLGLGEYDFNIKVAMVGLDEERMRRERARR